MKKYAFRMLIIFVLMLIIFDYVKASDSLSGRCIYLDPGHGGADPGAFYDVSEESINLSIAKKLKKELEKYGADVYLTRNGDYDLSSKDAKNRKRSDLYKRSRLINESKCDMYISLHLNAMKNSKWAGAQVFYDDINANNKAIAEIIQKELKNQFKTNRKVMKLASGYLYKRIKIPGVLVEMGFISNYSERKKLKSEGYQNLMAKTIRKGITSYFAKYQ